MSLDLSRIHALCFDVDGTLSDTDDMYTHKVARYLPRFLFHDPERAARRFVMWVESPGNALIGLPDIIGLDDELLGLWEWLNRHRPRPMKHFMMVPGTEEMLERLSGKYPMAVVSARDDKSTRAFLKQFELTDYFQEIVTAITAEPDPSIVAKQHAISDFRIKGDVVMIHMHTLSDDIPVETLIGGFGHQNTASK